MICTEEMLAKDKMEEECGVFGVYCKENKEVSQTNKIDRFRPSGVS